MKSRLGQVTIFIILAIVIVVGVVVYFILRNPLQQEVSANFRPVYDAYLTCLKEQAREGIGLMGEQAGWINPPEFVAGSQYMPFSSQLNFFGQPVPYWLYFSGNNFLKEQVPSRIDMQDQLAKYVEERVNYCNFDNFPNFNVGIGDKPSVKVTIEDSKVSIVVNNRLNISDENESISVNQQVFDVSSKIGKFHKLALDIYNFEKKNMFLESYALDVMRLYAPVTGVELTCAPKVFNEQKIRQDIAEGLSENFAMTKLKGNYYTLSSEENKYYITDIGQSVDENINFIYQTKMPTKIEIYGDMVNEPVGMQEGLGVLGFCYVPYHFVYDISFPVLIQLYDSKELFQFPVAVVIDKNQARQALEGQAGESISSDVCQYQNYPVEVFTYDSSLNPVEASLKFKCLNTECRIGETKKQGNDAVFNGGAPGCVNGFLIASAEGYAESKYQISTNEETSANIVLNKLYNISLDLGNVESALVNFNSPDYSAAVLYPDSKNVQLIEGNYNITVYAFKNSSIKLSAVSQKKCTNIPQSDLGGVFGLTEEKCFDISIPEQEVNMVLIGGGKAQEYLTEGQLSRAKKLNINIPLFKLPTTIQQVQDNYLLFEDSRVLPEVIE